MTKTFGQVSYNIYCNFTNYGSALHCWALSQAIRKLGHQLKLIDYCPEVLKEVNPLNPFRQMWDTDSKSRRLCELSMPAIRENLIKFNRFYNERFIKTAKHYTSSNFDEVVSDEKLDGFICGSDTIFCIDEFKGFDDGFFANYASMRNGYTISYAASFGDAHFDETTYPILNERLNNFKALGIRENQFIDYIKKNIRVPVQRTIDPTLLLSAQDYDLLAERRLVPDKYLLLYSRRYNKAMYDYADHIAEENGWRVVDISLRVDYGDRHLMYYHAGVEEFLSLVKHAELLVTNSYHGVIFATQYSTPFYIFSREQCDAKIDEVLNLFGLTQRKRTTGREPESAPCDFSQAHKQILLAREESIGFLMRALDACPT